MVLSWQLIVDKPKSCQTIFSTLRSKSLYNLTGIFFKKKKHFLNKNNKQNIIFLNKRQNWVNTLTAILDFSHKIPSL